MLNKLKELLKRFLPPPARTFHQAMERVLSAIDSSKRESAQERKRLEQELTGQLKVLAEENAALRKAMDDHMTQVHQQLTEFAESNIREVLLQELKKQHDELKAQKETRQQEQKKLADILLAHSSLLKEIQSNIKQVERIIPDKPVYWSNEFERRIVRENWGDVAARPDFAEKFVRLTAGMDSQSTETIIRILIRQKQYLGSEVKALDIFTRAEQEELRLLRENFTSEIIKLSDHLFAYKNYLLPINHFESSVFYFKHGIAQLQTRDRVGGKAIIDVGGFIGDSVLVLSELSPSTIYTFEAVPDNFMLLQKTMELNHIENVVAENLALGAESGSITVHVNGSGSTPIQRPGMDYKEDIEVPVTTLDEYVKKHGIDIGLIKVDIEGGEPAFLQGAKQTICQQKPILLISIYHNAHDFFELKPLIESWGLGYRFSIHKPTFGSVTGEALLIAEI